MVHIFYQLRMGSLNVVSHLYKNGQLVSTSIVGLSFGRPAMLSYLFRKDQSPTAPLPDYVSLAQNSNFTKGELKHLYSRFDSICNQETRLLERRPFLQQPELVFSPLIPIVYDFELRNFIFHFKSEYPTQTCPNGLTFDIFVKILSIFSQKASINAKLSCE